MVSYSADSENKNVKMRKSKTNILAMKCNTHQEEIQIFSYQIKQTWTE